MSQQCSWPTYSQPLEGHCLYYALLGLSQAPGLAGGYDYGDLSLSQSYVQYHHDEKPRYHAQRAHV